MKLDITCREGGGYEEEEGGYKELGGLEGVYASKWIR